MNTKPCRLFCRHTLNVSVMLALATGLWLIPIPTSYAAFPGANGKIAFDDDTEIYVINPDGTGLTRLTNEPASQTPAWSPDGTKIAFNSGRDGNTDVWVMNADGTGQVNLTNNPASNAGPAWSPDGTKIAFISDRDGAPDVYVMNADGTGQTRLTNGAAPTSLSWSPNGSEIAFASLQDGFFAVYVMNADGIGQTRLTNNQAGDSGPNWSPDGTKIAFTRVIGGNGQIFVMHADGTGQTNLSNSSSHDDGPAWAPDGTKLVFRSNRDGNSNIYVMNADGTGQTRVTTNFAVRPDWGPLTFTFTFTGFFPPISNPPVLNVVKAGQAIPVKFSLNGNQGLNIFATGYPISEQINCTTDAPLNDVQQTVTAGGSSLTYDPSTDAYTYVWKTDKRWGGTCRELIVQLTDGTNHVANFQFK